MTLFGKLRDRWRLAGYLANATDAGQVLVVVPAQLAADVSSYVWRRKVEMASDRWDANVADIPVTQWQAAISEIGRHRVARPRRSHGGKVLPVIRTPKAV